MKTGSHVLGAFNVDFESFVDNIVFCALIDRVGKYQLSMQRVSAYAPMAGSMALRARRCSTWRRRGPARRWVVKAAQVGDDHMAASRSIQKWVPRGLREVGDERGGGTNVKFGPKLMKNREARTVLQEIEGRPDLNLRYLRACCRS
jgi:1,2-phenylacetyl-CoA epoxidase catalytic subunit